MEDDASSDTLRASLLPASVAETVVSNLTDLDDDCLRAVELRLPLSAAAAFGALCKHTASMVSPVRDELAWARRVAESGFDRPAASRLAELKGMPRAAAHFGRAPLTMTTLEMTARILNVAAHHFVDEPVPGFEQLQPDISAAGGEYLLAERILADPGWARLPRAPLDDAGAHTVTKVFNPRVGRSQPCTTSRSRSPAVATSTL
jgi:hypothetical protein